MNTTIRSEIEDLYKKYKSEDSVKQDRLERWRNLEPESALLISIIIRSQQTKHLLEIGTSNGYSTLWFADALQTSGGRLTSVEIDPKRTQLARENLNRFGLSGNTELITADAKEFLKQAEANYETIFLDAERQYYIEYWNDLKRLLIHKKGAVLIVDNVISHQTEVDSFIEIIQNDDQMICTVVNAGAGLLLVTIN